MKESVINAFNAFQIADLDDDMVGICKAYVDLIQTLRNELSGEELPEPGVLENFYKLDPHLPRMELRRSYRDSLGYAVKRQEDEDINIVLKNIFIAVIAGTYAYHMPTEKIIEAGLQDKEFSRDEIKDILLADNMSPNWIKEPSGKDFTAIMI